MIRLIKLKEDKKINVVNHLNEFNNPSYIYIPVINNEKFGINDYIYKNQLINRFYASVSGVIENCHKVLYKNKIVYGLKIANDYKENIKEKNKSVKIQNKGELLELLKSKHLDIIYNKLEKLDSIDKLVVSSIDEEQYSLSEFLRLTHNYREVLDTIDELANILNVDSSILALKSTNYRSIKNVKSICGTYPNIEINLVPDKYCMSYKDYLCEYFYLEKENTLVLTTNEIYDLHLIMKGKCINEKLITISGDALEKSLIIKTRLYVSLNELLKEFFDIIDDDYEIYINGYLKGYKYDNLEHIIITEDIDTVVINKKEEKMESKCINCGACYKVCPQKINVLECLKNEVKDDKCIGCGLCNYICPANIDLKKLVMSDDNEKL